MKIKYFVLLAVAALCPAILSAQQPDVRVSTQEEIAADVNAAPCKNADRLAAVKELFKKMGAAAADISIEKSGDISNLVITKKGATEDTVIVGAHYDKVADGCGAIDNWTGITIIAHLFRTLKNVPTNKTFKFVAFDAEEVGLRGSDAMARAIPKEKRPGYCSMLNFDSFGFAYPRTFSEVSTPKMVAAAKTLSAVLQMPFADIRIPGAEADSASFKNRGIPAVTFDGLDGNWEKFLHSKSDKAENINMTSVLVGYRFAIRYTLLVEAAACDEYRKK